MERKKEKTKVTILLDRNLWISFRKKCIEKRKSASQTIEEMIRDKLKGW
jgi:hypothetical protein